MSTENQVRIFTLQDRKALLSDTCYEVRYTQELTPDSIRSLFWGWMMAEGSLFQAGVVPEAGLTVFIRTLYVNFSEALMERLFSVSRNGFLLTQLHLGMDKVRHPVIRKVYFPQGKDLPTELVQTSAMQILGKISPEMIMAPVKVTIPNQVVGYGCFDNTSSFFQIKKKKKI